MTKQLLDTHNAAKYLGDLRPNTLEGWRVKGIGPRWMKIGKLVRYDIAELDAYLTAQTRQSTSDQNSNVATFSPLRS